MNMIKIPAIFMAPEVRLCRDNGHIWTKWHPAVVTPRGTTEARYCMSCQSSQTRYAPEVKA